MTGEHMDPIAHDMENDEIDLRDLFLTIWDGRFIIAVITVVLVVLGGVYAKANPAFNASLDFRPLTSLSLIHI
mgnify:FL=1